MGMRIEVVIDTVFCASYVVNWRDTLPFDPLRGNHQTSIGNYEPCSIHRGSVAQQRTRLSG